MAESGARPRVSVVLPTLDGERDLQRLLPALARQELEGGLEIRAIDSSSRDGTRALLEAAGAAVTVIPRSEFRHGSARNRAARSALGQILVFLSQDAEPRDSCCLAELVGAFDDPGVMGATARCLPRPEHDPLTARTALAAPEADPVASVRELAAGESWGALAPDERARRARFSNSASAIRARAWQELPFPDLEWGEDAAWAAAALARGWRLAHVPSAVVWHAHTYGPRAAYRRNRTDAAFWRVHAGLRLRPRLYDAARGFLYEVREDWRHLRRTRAAGGWRWMARSLPLRAAQVAGQYAGSRERSGAA